MVFLLQFWVLFLCSSIQITDDSNVQTRELLYIVKELQSLFLSKDALINLGSITKGFPLQEFEEVVQLKK